MSTGVADATGVTSVPSSTELGVARVLHVAHTASTMDLAHAEAAAGEPAGLLVVADSQGAGRGRSGSAWVSGAGAGVWFTLLERPDDRAMLQVLALRLGLALADALAPLCDARIRLKWPNDVFAGRGKLAGILVETRWRDGDVEWVAIGIGINLAVPNDERLQAATLRAGVTRDAVLRAVVPAVRRAAASRGLLGEQELDAWNERDAALGCHILAPLEGRVAGIAADGALRVHTDDGERTVSSGSMVFASPDWLAC